MHEMFDLADEHKQSWHGWMYKPYGCIEQHLACDNKTNHSGLPGEIVVQNTSRTYPQAVAGHATSYKFDRESKAFELIYTVNAECQSMRTEVYFNEAMHYPLGYTTSVSPKSAVRVSVSENGFLLYLDHDESLQDGQIIHFTLIAK